MKRGKFANEVTRGLGARVTLHTRRALQAQMQTEGGSAKNNPFNTTLRMAGSTDYNKLPNGVAVQNYVSAAQGIEATLKTLREEGHGYGKIRRRIRLNAPAWAIVDAIIESDWGTGRAPGKSEALIEEVLDDIQHDRVPNKLSELEAKQIAS